jgi:hypothetical protein
MAKWLLFREQKLEHRVARSKSAANSENFAFIIGTRIRVSLIAYLQSCTTIIINHVLNTFLEEDLRNFQKTCTARMGCGSSSFITAQ